MQLSHLSREINKKIKFFNQTFEKINFKNKFDVIACFHTLEHIFDINIYQKFKNN